MKGLLWMLLLFAMTTGCGSSNEPVIPENPDPPPAGPTKEGLPAAPGAQG